MNNDIDWMTSLGEAVVADQGAVLAAVQTFRRKAQAAGNLKTDDKQVVVVEKEVVKIVPADPQVIYVPQYNPSTVVVSGGYSSFGYYPSAYPVYYYPYPSGAALATGLVWGAAIGAAWNGGRYTTNYGGGGTANININRSATVNNNINRSNVSSARTSSTQWKANKQPGQVRSTAGRPPSARVGYSTGAGYASAGRVPAQSASSRSSSNVNRQSASGSAFSGSSSGYQTHLDSSRGAASRNSMSGRSFSQMPRGGCGGGGRGGGGRGGRR